MPGPPVASGERVTLRTFESEDVPFAQRSFTEPEIRYPLGNPVWTRDEIADHVEDDDGDRFVVCLDGPHAGPNPDVVDSAADVDAPDAPSGDVGGVDPDTGETRRIGSVSVDDADWKRPELAYWLVPEVHGEGYATEALTLVLDYIFRVHDTPAVGAGAYAYNDASRGLLESLGFEEEGRSRKHRFVDGEHRDLVRYGLLREEWREGRANDDD